jgi:hypothetical protein
LKYTIYKICLKDSDKCYIGMTSKSLKVRFKNHVSKFKQLGITPFQKEMLRLGKENFHIQSIAKTNDYNEALDLERYYIEKMNTIENGYNTFRGGSGTQIHNDDYYKTMVETFHKTKSIRETARIFNKCEGTISRQLTTLGIDKGIYSRLSSEEKENAKKLREEGLSYLKISKQMNRNIETIRSLFNENKSKRKKFSPNRNIKVVELNKKFNSVKECCEFLLLEGKTKSVNVCKSKVTLCLNGNKKTYMGYTFEDIS